MMNILRGYFLLSNSSHLSSELPNIAVSINGTSYSPATTTMSTTGWTSNNITVSPTLNFTTGQNITIVFTFTGGMGGATLQQRLDELKIFGSAVALPIELTKFIAEPAPVGFDLHWLTASERNNDYFAVERSYDRQSYVKITRIDGAGNSSITQSYKYNDRTPLKGVNYYRLRQVDNDGTETLSKVVSVTTTGKGTGKIKIYLTHTEGVVSIANEELEIRKKSIN